MHLARPLRARVEIEKLSSRVFLERNETLIYMKGGDALTHSLTQARTQSRWRRWRLRREREKSTAMPWHTYTYSKYITAATFIALTIVSIWLLYPCQRARLYTKPGGVQEIGLHHWHCNLRQTRNYWCVNDLINSRYIVRTMLHIIA